MLFNGGADGRYARNGEAEPKDKGRRGCPGRGRKMQPNGIRDSPLRTTKPRKDRTRQASAIRSELLMTSLLSGALEPDSEFSFYLPRSALPGLSNSKGVPYDPLWLHLPSPAWTAPPTFVFRFRIPIPCVPLSPTLLNNNSVQNSRVSLLTD